MIFLPLICHLSGRRFRALFIDGDMRDGVFWAFRTREEYARILRSPPGYAISPRCEAWASSLMPDDADGHFITHNAMLSLCSRRARSMIEGY